MSVYIPAGSFKYEPCKIIEEDLIQRHTLYESNPYSHGEWIRLMSFTGIDPMVDYFQDYPEVQKLILKEWL